MTPSRLKQIRHDLGLSTQGLANALRMAPDSGRTVRRWESGETPISGPASVAIEFMHGMGMERFGAWLAENVKKGE